MQAVMFLIICSVMLDEFIVKTFGLPTPLRFLPEMLSLVVIVYVVIAGTRDGFRLVSRKYWLAFSAFAIVIVCGVVNNASGSGPMLSGMRFYLRAVPLFFLPAVLLTSEDQLKRQFQCVLGLSLLQLPVAIYQRWLVMSEGRYTGDEVRGTLMDSGILSIFLICTVLVLTGLMLKNRVRKGWYAALFLPLLFPSVINETKGTLIMLPFGLIVTLVLGSDRGKRLRYAGLALSGLILFSAIFIPVYDMMEAHNPYKNEKDIVNYFTNQKQLEKYLSSDVSGVGTNKSPRRGDAIVIPLQFIAKDPAQLAFGLGIGSVSPSNFGKNFEGAYYLLFKNFLITSFTFFLLEFGILGLIMIAALFWLVFADTLFVARSDDTLTGALAAGWTGVVALVALAMIYTIFHEFTSVTYLYWYFSGVICARRMAILQASGPVRMRSRQPELVPVATRAI